MNARMRYFIASLLLLSALGIARAQSETTQHRHLTIEEAVQLALKHNHMVRITQLQVEEKQHAKDVARSAYYPDISNQSKAFHWTDTQFIQIAQGSLGTVNGTPIPEQSETILQGGRTFVLSESTLSQQLTPLLTRVRPTNDAARADLNVSRANAKETENVVALKVHQLYYAVLITQLRRSASEARIKAADDLKTERVQQVKYGNALDQDVIESTAQTLQAKQELLTTELQLSDLTLELNDAMGLPLSTELELDPSIPGVQNPCALEECIKAALEAHPEITSAREEVEKASAGVRLSKADYVPDISAWAREDYQDNIPFLARNFGSFGVQFNYDLFDGGRRRAAVRESEAKLEQAKENLARVTEDVELQVQIAYNKMQRTQQMVSVSEELVALRTESSRVSAQQLEKGEAVPSQVDFSVAQEFDAKTSLLQSQLDYIQAHDEMTTAMGLTPQ